MIKKIILLISILLVVAIIYSCFWVLGDLQTPAAKDAKDQVISIENGSSIWQISKKLEDEGLIKHRSPFVIYVKLRDLILRAGEYELSASLSPKSIADIVGGGQIKTARITIPEGYRMEQIAQKLAEQNVVAYNDFITAAKGKEGYLFPDTYEFHSGITAEKIVEKMTDNFIKRTSGFDISADDLIMASIIEREAKFDEDRAKIAGVFKNRLRAKMKLEADPTVFYANDNIKIKNLSEARLVKYDYWGKIAFADYLNINSPYNTYVSAGLPPAPMCNPGIKSIEAAQSPDENDYLFFLQASDGTTYYAKTSADHDANKKKYLK